MGRVRNKYFTLPLKLFLIMPISYITKGCDMNLLQEIPISTVIMNGEFFKQPKFIQPAKLVRELIEEKNSPCWVYFDGAKIIVSNKPLK
jgi:hypothetical protein